MIDYSYQNRAAKIVLNNALKKKYIASILAACPGAGKTTISHKIINEYLRKFPQARVVVLTEGQKTLKNQYLAELDSAHVPIKFTYGDFQSNAQVRVGIPQSIKTLKWNSFDLLIVDEAHNFYLADMVQAIVKRFAPKHKVLMTGSPAKYTAYNQTSLYKYAIHYIAAETLRKMGVFSAVSMDVVSVESRQDPCRAMESVLAAAKSNKDNLSKIMVACPTIKYARAVSKFLASVGRNVALSTSENDSNDVAIKSFKQGQADALVVVGKGILGFNCKEITLLIDLRSSQNVDASYQLFARVLRTHPENIEKAYYRVAEKDHFNREVLMLHKIKAITYQDVYVNYNGHNLEVGEAY